MNKYEKAIIGIRNFREDRPTLKDNDNYLTLSCLLEGEAREVTAAAMIHMMLQNEQSKDDLALEIADVIIFALNFADYAGIDAFQAVLDKLAINLARYQAKFFTNGLTYRQGVDQAREEWAITEGMKDFKSE